MQWKLKMGRGKTKYFRKGYIYIFFYSLIIPMLGILKYPRSNGPVTITYFLFRTAVGFIIFFIPLFFIVGWYYKQKDK